MHFCPRCGILILLSMRRIRGYKEVCPMKTFFKLVAVLAMLGGICLAITLWLERRLEPEYIPIYGAPHEDGQ